MKLQIGCGNDYRDGYINLDGSSAVKNDIVWNLENLPLPFENDQFDEILANHVFEHVKDFVPLIHDLHRITKKGGIIHARTPFYSSWGQFNDPTHVRFFTPWTFDYFSVGNYSHEVGVDGEFIKKRSVKLNFGVGSSKSLNFVFNPLVNINHKIYCRFFAWIFPVAEIEYALEVIK